MSSEKIREMIQYIDQLVQNEHSRTRNDATHYFPTRALYGCKEESSGCWLIWHGCSYKTEIDGPTRGAVRVTDPNTNKNLDSEAQPKSYLDDERNKLVKLLAMEQQNV